MLAQIRVLIVDDHALVRQGIIGVLARDPVFAVVGEAADGLEAQEQARTLRPDVILMDVRMPGCDGLAATRKIKGAMPAVRIVMLTISEEERDLFEAIKSGAQGYLLKRIEPPELCAMVRAAYRGEAPISPIMAGRIVDDFGQRNSGPPPRRNESQLSPREREVLSLVAQGLSNKQVAATLGISENTVRNHLCSILEKLHLNNRVEAATYAVREGLATPPVQEG